jgi:hypothetical protein
MLIWLGYYPFDVPIRHRNLGLIESLLSFILALIILIRRLMHLTAQDDIDVVLLVPLGLNFTSWECGRVSG